MKNIIINADCFKILPLIIDNSIDCIICDLPYGMTGNKWDVRLNLEILWKHYNRIIKDDGVIVLFSSQPFTSILLLSNINMFRFEIIWEKSRGSNFIHSKFQPLKCHENILIFAKKPAVYNKKENNNMKYNPQMSDGASYDKGIVTNDSKNLIGTYKEFKGENKSGKRFPRSVQYISSDSNGRYRGINPTQKPVALLEYLIKTFSNDGDLILDNTAGSMSLAVACDNTNRNWICIERDEIQCEMGLKWVNENRRKLNKNETFIGKILV